MSNLTPLIELVSAINSTRQATANLKMQRDPSCPPPLYIEVQPVADDLFKVINGNGGYVQDFNATRAHLLNQYEEAVTEFKNALN